jgi:hypothetical protein
MIVQSTEYSDRVLLTVHGSPSDNVGLANLCEFCETQLPGLITDTHFYQPFVPLKDLTRSIREVIYTNVRHKIENVWFRHVNRTQRKLFIVAHSFGTLAVVRALEMRIPGVHIHGLILLGSIIPRAHYWDGLIIDRQLREPPLAVIRPFDFVVRFAKNVDGGDSGARGFIANGKHRAYETFKNGGHSAYDPDDFADVVTAIRTGIASVTRTPYKTWKNSCDFSRRAAHGILHLADRLRS